MLDNISKTTPKVDQDQIEKLKEIYPEIVSEGKVDFDRLKATLGEAEALAGDNAYNFSWAGKEEIFRTIQAPSAASLKPDIEESVNWEETRNLFIEGENLEVLKLLYKSYFGKVKMIYIDPPYNTGSDFVYKDDYSQPRKTYLEKTGQMDADGNILTSNPESSGRYHSDWLNMMYPRLFLARQLLRKDGIIFISIDDHEVHHLRILMNELFGEENFIAQITIRSNPRGRQAERHVAAVHEYVLVYARDEGECSIGGKPLTEEQKSQFKYQDEEGRRYRLLGLRQRGSASRREDRPNMYFPIYVDPQTKKVSIHNSDTFTEEVLPKKSTGKDGRWMWGRDTVEEKSHMLEARLITTRDEWDIFVRDYLSDEKGNERTRKYKTIWTDKAINYQNGTTELKELFETTQALVEYPKPTFLLKQLIRMSNCDDGDICMDFFAGSCTTAQAILEMNRADNKKRQFIMVQLNEKVGEESAAKEYGFKSISEIGKERIRLVINKMNNGGGKGKPEQQKLHLNTEVTEDLGFKALRLFPSTFRQWENPIQDQKEEALERQLAFFDRGLKEAADSLHVIYEVILKEGFDLNAKIQTDKIEDNKIFRVEQPGDEMQFFYLCLDEEVQNKTIEALPLDEETKFICLDTALDDSQKVNLSMQSLLKTI